MDVVTFERDYWNYYLVLENDFISTERYVTLHEDNMNAFSVEFSKQYQSICSEIDVLMKGYCKLLDPTKNVSKIKEYAIVINDKKPDFVSKKIEVLGNRPIVLEPWKDLGEDKKPDWWYLYNKVKHFRIDNDIDGKPFYCQANLRNVLTALAALYQLETFYYRDIAVRENKKDYPSTEASLFEIENWRNILRYGNLILEPI